MNAPVDMVDTTLQYGDHVFDHTALPLKSLMALLRSGLSHKMGNEVSSRVSTAKKARETNGEAPHTEEELAALKTQFEKEMAEAIRNGTVGASNRGPRGTAVDTIFNQKCEQKVRDLLKAQGKTMPSGDKTVTLSNGQAFTRAELMDRVKARYGDALRAEAEKEHARRQREAAKALGAEGDTGF